jgi:hypothetical protein
MFPGTKSKTTRTTKIFDKKVRQYKLNYYRYFRRIEPERIVKWTTNPKDYGMIEDEENVKIPSEIENTICGLPRAMMMITWH